MLLPFPDVRFWHPSLAAARSALGTSVPRELSKAFLVHFSAGRALCGNPRGWKLLSSRAPQFVGVQRLPVSDHKNLGIFNTSLPPLPWVVRQGSPGVGWGGEVLCQKLLSRSSEDVFPTQRVQLQKSAGSSSVEQHYFGITCSFLQIGNSWN